MDGGGGGGGGWVAISGPTPIMPRVMDIARIKTYYVPRHINNMYSTLIVIIILVEDILTIIDF